MGGITASKFATPSARAVLANRSAEGAAAAAAAAGVEGGAAVLPTVAPKLYIAPYNPEAPILGKIELIIDPRMMKEKEKKDEMQLGILQNIDKWHPVTSTDAPNVVLNPLYDENGVEISIFEQSATYVRLNDEKAQMSPWYVRPPDRLDEGELLSVMRDLRIHGNNNFILEKHAISPEVAENLLKYVKSPILIQRPDSEQNFESIDPSRLKHGRFVAT